ncbi:MAG: peptide deformylase [Puniceicoccaceae bacterium]
MLLRVIQYGEPVLREKGEAVKSFDGELLRLARDMRETMEAHEGIGLAAQQVGVALRLCVVDLGPAVAETGMTLLDGKMVPPAVLMPLFLANPRVEPIAPVEVGVMEEGCLSFRGIRGEVPRPNRIEVSYQDLDGQAHVLVCEELLARCIQHEVDHLEGVLFIDRMPESELRGLRKKLRRLSRGSPPDTNEP